MNGNFRFLQTQLSETNKKLEQLNKRIKDLEEWKEKIEAEIEELISR